MKKNMHVSMGMDECEMPTRVIIEEADNGYVVSCMDDDGDSKWICKDLKEVNKAVVEAMSKEQEEPKESYSEVKSKAMKKMLSK